MKACKLKILKCLHRIVFKCLNSQMAILYLKYDGFKRDFSSQGLMHIYEYFKGGTKARTLKIFIFTVIDVVFVEHFAC